MVMVTGKSRSPVMIGLRELERKAIKQAGRKVLTERDPKKMVKGMQEFADALSKPAKKPAAKKAGRK